MSSVHGGVKFYRSTPKAARAYLELDHSTADDYYLHEGSGLADRYVATPERVVAAGSMDGDTYESWVAGIDVDTGLPKGRLRADSKANRFLEVTVNGPKSWSLAAALNPEISTALDGAQDEAAREIISYLAQHSTTRVGPRGRQVQVPVESIESAVIRHYTSRAGDPHRHLHLQINTRVRAAGKWRGLHTVGTVDMLEAINGIGHAAVATNPGFRKALADHGFSIDPVASEIRELAPFVGAFSARAEQITRNINRYEADWRSAHPGEEPGPRLRRIWDHRAWADARPDKVIPKNGADLIARWNQELDDLGYGNPGGPVVASGVLPGRVDRDAAARFVIQQLGAKKSAWNAADIRGKAEILLTRIDLVTEPAARIDLAEDITARAHDLCTRLLERTDVPEHVRSLTSATVLEVEADLINRIAARASSTRRPARLPSGMRSLSSEQAIAAAVLAGDAPLVVVEGAAGAGKTKTLASVRKLLGWRRQRMMVVTPTLKAAHVVARETGATGHSAAWLIHQHGWRWNDDGHWTRDPSTSPSDAARLRQGDLLVVDEAGMLDQDTARALFTIADETGARIALVGDRHQLPAVGRGGVLDHAATWTPPPAQVSLTTVHRFTDPKYAKITTWMRTGTDPGVVFDHLRHQGHIALHGSETERTAALAEAGANGELVVADTRDQVRELNATIRAKKTDTQTGDDDVIVTSSGETIGLGDRVATRRNDPRLQVANRQTWIVTGIGEDGGVLLHGEGRDRWIPAGYVKEHVELAYATTVYGIQGDTVDRAHFALTDTTGAAATYVAMTRGREANTVHIVANHPREARDQWVAAFNRDRADLGPAHARQHAIEQIDLYGSTGRSPTPAGPSIGF